MTAPRKTRPPASARPNKGKWTLPAYCPGSDCDAENSLKECNVENTMLINGEETRYTGPKYVCTECETAFSSPAQATAGAKAAREAYRKAHILLTAEEMKTQRKALNWSQVTLADKAGVGSASIKRWELGLSVQTRDNDNAIRHAFSLGPLTDGMVCVFVQQSVIVAKERFWPARTLENPATRNAFSAPLEEGPLSYGITDEAFETTCYA